MSALQLSHEALIPDSRVGGPEGKGSDPPVSRGFCLRLVTVMKSVTSLLDVWSREDEGES